MDPSGKGVFLSPPRRPGNAILRAMKKLTSLAILLSSSVATLLLAVGLNEAAQKMDPVAQKSTTISTMQTGDIASMPCMSCSTGEEQDPPFFPKSDGLV
jgi:hypothetical protein